MRHSWMFAVVCCALSSAALADYTTVSIAPIANDNIDSISSTSYPHGSQTYFGVPFDLLSSGSDNIWNAAASSDPNPRTATLTVSIPDATTVYTLINTAWGQSGPTSYAAVTFNATGGVNYTVNLVGDDDIRDYNNFTWTNSINGTTTQNVWASGSTGQYKRMDMQTITLPSTFLGQTLTSIVFTDTGSNPNFQRMLVMGATVQAVPEPAALTLIALGAVPLLRRSGRRGRRA